MLTINAQNVNDAYRKGLLLIDQNGFQSDSRNGKVLKFGEPVATVYEYPHERVLFDTARDANPFFHLFEAIWMLGGHNDVEFPAKFAAHIRTFSDDGETLHGAYGWRWRNHFKVDQINLAIYELMRDPFTRRVVLSMWDPYVDPPVAQAGGKDVPCNTHVYFNVRPENADLSMTVCNRSNDMIWGAYGANVVHMSILQEYVALASGLPIGEYTQISNDLHVYERHFPLVSREKMFQEGPNPYDDPSVIDFSPLWSPTIGETKDHFDADVKMFLGDPNSKMNDYRTRFFARTVQEMYKTWKLHKAGFHESALQNVEQIEAKDWREAARQWVARRPPKVKVIGEA